MRRILLLITDLEIGGTPTVVRELALRLRDPSHVEIEVACLSKWGPVADQLRDAGVRVTALGAGSPLDFLRTLFRLVRLIREGNFDTVFSFLIHANAMATAAAPFCPEVRFLQSIQTTQPEPRWHWWLQRLIQHAAAKVVVPSPSAAEVAKGWAGVARERAVVISNAVDIESFNEIYAGNAARQAQTPRRVGFIGRLDPIKRVPDLVMAMSHQPSGRLDIYGEGVDRPAIEAAVRRWGLQDRVKLHGAITRPHEALATMDVLVLPSKAEGFGLVLIEAMAAGVPVIGADVPGIRDVIRHLDTGLLLEDVSPMQFVQAIVTATHTVLRASLISNARAEVERQFSWPAVLPRYRELLGLR
ncbi:glycosyltransferase [Humisphaera borealis]|uniref:Glycosyltransferase n=1 Tax=Humisphaera borealis TaxID=2807512 RepID=A0A7M2WZQ6_9BACT|nr:glycosyltransferase [Humisphaera borealis]QOV90997.1 glycosyltransferase [Humisphaera borealis]